MSAYPRVLSTTDISPSLARLIRELAERLLDGPTATHRALRAQLASARIERVTLTGAGLYADFSHGPTVGPASPAEAIGGQLVMKVPGLAAGAGSLVKVSRGRLEFVEVYTMGDGPWPDDPAGVVLGESVPLPLPAESV